jgi:hypothetical protein
MKAKKQLTFSEIIQKKLDKHNKRQRENQALMERYSKDGKTVNIMDMLNQMKTEKSGK